MKSLLDVEDVGLGWWEPLGESWDSGLPFPGGASPPADSACLSVWSLAGEDAAAELLSSGLEVASVLASPEFFTGEAARFGDGLFAGVLGAGGLGLGDLGPGDLGPGDPRLGDLGPGDLGPGDPRLGDLGPGDLGPGDLDPCDLGPGDLEPSDLSVNAAVPGSATE